MLTPNRLDKLPEPMIQLMSELQNEIISDICRRITKANYLTPTAEWQLYKANQLTISAREVKRRIAAKLKVRESTLKELYTDAVKTAIREDEIIYKAAIAEGILSDNYRDKLTNYTRSKAFSSVLQRGLKNTNGLMRNLTNSAAAAANRQLSDALDLAFLKCVSGAFTPQDAIFEAVRKLGQDGLKCVNYESGRTDQLDVAVRRAVVTGIGKTCCDMQLDLAKEMDCELVEVTAHLGARPSHAEWQGQIYSLKKGHPKYPYFYDATGYGTGDGLGGWNCRHSFFPYFEGLSVAANAPTFSKEENLEEYTNTQKQRAYERSIRKSKRELAALDSARQEASPELRAKLDREFERKSVTLKKREARLEEHLKATGLLPDNSRVRVDGFGKSVSQKAVWANKKYIANISTNIQSGNINGFTFEAADKKFINSNGYKKQFVGLFDNAALERKIEKYSTKAVLNNDNKPSETIFTIPTSSNPFSKVTEINKKHYWDLADGVGEKLSSLKNEFILVHNHPNNTSLSLSDLKALNDIDKMRAVISVGHNGKICVVSAKPTNKFVNHDDLDFFDRAYGCSIRDYGQTNEAIKDFCNKVGWKYHEQSI